MPLYNTPGTPVPYRSTSRTASISTTLGGAFDVDGIGKAVTGLVDRDFDLVVGHEHDIGRAAAVDIAQKDAGRRVVSGKPGRRGHRDSCAEVSVASVRPVVDATAVDEHDILEAVAGHIGEPESRRAEIQRLGRIIAVELNPGGLLPGFLGIGVVVKPDRKLPGLDDVGQSVAGQIHHDDIRIGQIDRGKVLVADKRALVPAAIECEREVSLHRRLVDQKVGPAVAVGVDKLHVAVGQAEARR